MIFAELQMSRSESGCKALGGAIQRPWEPRSKGPWSGDPKPSRAFECTTSKLKTEVEKRTPKVPHKISFTERRFWDIFWQSVCKKNICRRPSKRFAFSRLGPPGGRGGVKGGAGSPRRRVSGADLRFSSFFQILDHSGRLQKMF